MRPAFVMPRDLALSGPRAPFAEMWSATPRAADCGDDSVANENGPVFNDAKIVESGSPAQTTWTPQG